MADQNDEVEVADGVDQQVVEQIIEKEPSKEYYIDPEGGYKDPEAARIAELTAMTKQAPVSVNNLPTKAYLEQAITPTVMKALSEVCKARPDNPIEFVAYYILKHNPNRVLKNDGAPSGYKHPEDRGEAEDGDDLASSKSQRE